MNKPVTKQIEVQIMGQSYLLACPAGGEQSLLEAVERVDTAMCRIRDAGKVKARDRIAVLASLNLAFELSQKEALLLSQAVHGPAADAAPATLGTSLSSEAADPQAQARVDDLLQRLDQALGSDGQLI
jgi:cell division protein ZapA